MEAEIWKVILSQGPFAVLFVWMLMRSEKRNEIREQEYRQEIRSMKEEFAKEREEWRRERVAWTETLNNFSKKYDLICDELRDLAGKITGRMDV